MVRYDVLITGRVQGVGFRWFACRQAACFDVTGWVSNRDDGMVELEVQGEPERVEGFLAAIRAGNGAIEVERLYKGSLHVVPEREFVVREM